MYSPCIWADNKLKLRSDPCRDYIAPDCASNPAEFARANTAADNNGIVPVGIARDGRPIYNPYKHDGTLWQPCEVDICNGRYAFLNYYVY